MMSGTTVVWWSWELPPSSVPPRRGHRTRRRHSWSMWAIERSIQLRDAPAPAARSPRPAGPAPARPPRCVLLEQRSPPGRSSGDTGRRSWHAVDEEEAHDDRACQHVRSWRRRAGRRAGTPLAQQPEVLADDLGRGARPAPRACRAASWASRPSTSASPRYSDRRTRVGRQLEVGHPHHPPAATTAGSASIRSRHPADSRRCARSSTVRNSASLVRKCR